MAKLYPVIRWPGVRSPVTLSYTVSHGIAPGMAVLKFNPQTVPPAMSGTLEFGDGIRSLSLRDCVVERLNQDYSTTGIYHTIHILDRRWRWRTGTIDGHYNELDNAGKLVPWKVRSPTELALLCLKEQGEQRIQLRLPKGLSQADIPKLNRLLRTGENFPQTNANPECLWDTIPPMVALQRLATLFECRIAWDPATDTVGVGPVGVGDGLPTGGQSVAFDSSGVTARPRPKAVGVAGGWVRHQMRFPLEPVGKEWDDLWLPIDQLSYAPRGREPRQMVVKAGRMTRPPRLDPDPVELFVVNGQDVTAADFEEVKANIDAADLPVTATLIGDDGPGQQLILSAKEYGHRFHVRAKGVSTFLAQNTESVGMPDWSLCGGFTFPNVQATGRLSYAQAQERAAAWVFKAYRIRVDVPYWAERPGGEYRPWQDPDYRPYKVLLDVDTNTYEVTFPPEDGSLKPDDRRRLKVPDSDIDRLAPTLLRRQQVTLLDTKNEYLKPQPRELVGQAFVRNRPSSAEFGVAPPFYSGVSRRQAATVHGAVSRLCLGDITTAGAFDDFDVRDHRLYMPFSVVAEEGVVLFSRPVYRQQLWGVFGTATPAQLWIECACYFDFAGTGQRRRPRFTRAVGGTAPTDWQVRDDVWVDLNGRYTGSSPHRLTKTDTDKLDADGRSRYYLDGMVANYQLVGAQTRTYNGIFPVGLTGKVQQVRYDCGVGGVHTMAAMNTEFAWNTAPYPARRLEENLPPDRQAAAANRAEADQRQGTRSAQGRDVLMG